MIHSQFEIIFDIEEAPEMRFRKPGRISDNLWYLGAEEAGVYMLRGQHETVLINGAMTYILPAVLTQMREFEISSGEITKILILHSHFDHVGIVPYFKRNYPAIEIIASKAAIKTLQKPKAIEFINTYNPMMAGARKQSLKGFDLDWRSDLELHPLGEGDVIDLGETALKIYETPGHSDCSISAYVPDAGILFGSDAIGIPFSDKLFPSMSTNIDQYLKSLEKLKPLEVNISCHEHYGYITGQEAQTIVVDSIREALNMKERLYEVFRRNPDIDSAVKEIASAFYEEMPGYFLAPELREGAFKQIFKHIAKTLETSGRPIG